MPKGIDYSIGEVRAVLAQQRLDPYHRDLMEWLLRQAHREAPLLMTVSLFEMPQGIIGFMNVSRVPVAGEIVHFDRPGSPNEEAVHRLVLGVVHSPSTGIAAEVHLRTMAAGEAFPWYTEAEVR